MVIGQKAICQIIEGDSLLSHSREPTSPNLADSLLKQPARLFFALGVRTFAEFLAAMVICDPVDGTALEDAAHPSH